MGRQLLFIFYKMDHTKDIQCSNISSWIKNTIKFCYSKVDDADLDLIRVKAHDARACSFQGLLWGSFHGSNYASLPLEITQHLYQVLPQRSCRTRPNRGLLPLMTGSAEPSDTIEQGIHPFKVTFFLFICKSSFTCCSLNSCILFSYQEFFFPFFLRM